VRNPVPEPGLRAPLAKVKFWFDGGPLKSTRC
jgi:hypothetical protein